MRPAARVLGVFWLAAACKTPSADTSTVAEASAGAQPAYSTFCDWDHNRASLPPGAQLIVDQIKTQASTCEQASSLGSATLMIDLSTLDPSGWDLRPLASLALTSLNIKADKVGDLSVLKGIGGLRDLALRGTSAAAPPTGLEQLAGFVDLKSLDLSGYNFGGNTAWLSAMTQLTQLSIKYSDFGDNDLKKLIPLNRNLTNLTLQHLPITDLAPLGLLVNLTYLILSQDSTLQNVSDLGFLINLTTLIVYQCKVSDVTALGNLTFLYFLSLEGNHIKDVTPLASLVNLSGLDLNDNDVSDFSPLANLKNLQQLQVSFNPGTPDHCPVPYLSPPTPCEIQTSAAN